MLFTTGLSILSALTGCDRSGSELVPRPSDAFPGVIEAGEVRVITEAELDEMTATGPDYCVDDGTGLPCLYGQLGATEQGTKGGATFTFTATGGDVCIIADPEAVFWSTSISSSATGKALGFRYPDNTLDDGDVDVEAGLSSYYTGSPGVELGTFAGYYTDSLGREIEISYSECIQDGYTGQVAYAGRATHEYCTVSTEGREGAEYTVVLSTFAVPLDDGVLSFGAVVVDGTCSRVSPTECTITGESLDESGNTRDCSLAMEAAFCDGNQPDMTSFCCANPDMCGDAPEEDVCLQADFDRDAYCAETPEFCCFEE